MYKEPLNPAVAKENTALVIDYQSKQKSVCKDMDFDKRNRSAYIKNGHEPGL